MKLGFITSILDGWTYEQMMDFASEQGFECVEVACWPEEKAERRYAGVSHIDAERVNQDDEYAAHIMAYAEKAGVEISALHNYPSSIMSDPVHVYQYQSEDRRPVLLHSGTHPRSEQLFF